VEEQSIYMGWRGKRTWCSDVCIEGRWESKRMEERLQTQIIPRRGVRNRLGCSLANSKY
jgi:hypothetical protein